MTNQVVDFEALNQFSVQWAQSLPYKENEVFSGPGYAMLALLLAASARDEVLCEMAGALGVDKTKTMEQFKLLRQHFSETEGFCEAVGVWVQSGVGVGERFKEAVAPTTIDQLPDDKKVLDAWVKTQTQGMIEEFPVSTDAHTLMALATVVTAEAAWTYPFEEANCQWEGDQITDGLVKSTTNLDEVSVLSNGESRISRLLCETDKHFDVYLVAGEEGDAPQKVLSTAIAACSKNSKIKILKGSDLKVGDKAGALEVKKRMSTTKTPSLDVALPVFKVANTHDLLEKKDLFGLREATNMQQHNFPAISTTPLAVATAAQSATAVFSAVGFKAGAVTAVDLILGAALRDPTGETYHIDFSLNQPFGFVVVDRLTQLVLFTGWVATPQG